MVSRVAPVPHPLVDLEPLQGEPDHIGRLFVFSRM